MSGEDLRQLASHWLGDFAEHEELMSARKEIFERPLLWQVKDTTESTNLNIDS